MTTTLPPSGDTPAELAEHLASGARLVEAFHLMPGVARAMREAARLLRKPCTCHPDDNPPMPCPQKFALSECKAADALERAKRAEAEAAALQKANIALRAMLREPRHHKYWGAGEPDCPQDIKAPNGELHTLRCKVCGLDSPHSDICQVAIDAAMQEGK